MHSVSFQTVIWETLKKMIHTILSCGRVETNITFNYFKPSVMTHISLGCFQNQLPFSNRKLLLTIQENNLLTTQENKQDELTLKITVQLSKLSIEK